MMLLLLLLPAVLLVLSALYPLETRGLPLDAFWGGGEDLSGLREREIN